SVRWPHKHHGAIRRTATYVHYQYFFVVMQAGFKIKPCGQRFKQKFDIAKSNSIRGSGENRQCLLIGRLRVDALEIYRATNDHLCNSKLQETLGTLSHVEHHGRQHTPKKTDHLRTQATRAQKRIW